MTAEATILELPLTGERSYVHGADIFDAVIASTGATADIVLTLRLAANCAIALVAPVNADANDPDLCGSVRYRVAGVQQRRLLRRLPGRPATIRLPLDEEELTAKAIFGADRASIPPGSGSFVRRAGSACLVLLEGHFPDDYWSITEVACSTPPPATVGVEVSLAPLLGGRYWKAILSPFGAEPVGTLVLARGGPRR